MIEKTNLWDKVWQNRALTHTLFWLTLFFIAPITSDGSIKNTWEAFIFRGVALPMKIIPTYFLVYYLIPRFFQKKKYILFSIYFAISAVFFTIIYRFNNIHIAETLAGLDEPKESLLQIIYELKFTMSTYFLRTYFYAALFMSLKAFKDGEIKKRQIVALEKEKAKTELNFLKAQIHPHFLFNTLNNLYALTLDKSDEAPEVVAKLAEMLDYMLYQCKDAKVLINKEIELLQHYIDLEKLRYGNRLQLTFEHSTDNAQALIAPLILISMVENAFKHGVSGAMQAVVIKISLKVKNNHLYFQVFNTKASNTQSNPMDYKKGIGIKNIQRQLELIYPDQYDWQVTETETSYEVNFHINL